MKNARVQAEGHLHVVRAGDREMRVGSFPIGIDAAGFRRSGGGARGRGAS